MPGDRKAIIGPNGAGKTTLFNVITGIFPATVRPDIILFGQDVTTWPSHRRTALGMARTFQVTSLFPKLTVLDNVLLAIKGLRPSKFVMWRFLSSYKEVYDKAYHLLEQAPASSTARTSKCAICRTASSASSRSFWGWPAIRRFCCSTSRPPACRRVNRPKWPKFLMKLDPNLAILLIEHDMDVVFDVASQISVLHFGEILETGTPQQIHASAKVQEIYLGTD